MNAITSDLPCDSFPLERTLVIQLGVFSVA